MGGRGVVCNGRSILKGSIRLGDSEMKFSP